MIDISSHTVTVDFSNVKSLDTRSKIYEAVANYNYSIDNNFGLKSLMRLAHLKDNSIDVKKFMFVNISFNTSSGIKVTFDFKKCTLPELDKKDKATKGPDYNFYGGYYNRETGYLYVSPLAASNDFIPFMDLAGYLNAILSGIISIASSENLTDKFNFKEIKLSNAAIDRLLQHLKIACVKDISKLNKNKKATNAKKSSLIDAATDIGRVIKSIQMLSTIDTTKTVTAILLSENVISGNVTSISQDHLEEFLAGCFAVFEQLMLYANVLRCLPVDKKDNFTTGDKYFDNFLNCNKKFINFFDYANVLNVTTSRTFYDIDLVDYDFLNPNSSEFVRFKNDTCKRLMCSKYRYTTETELVTTQQASGDASTEYFYYMTPYKFSKMLPTVFCSNFIYNKTAQYLINKLIQFDEFDDQGNVLKEADGSYPKPKLISDVNERNSIMSYFGVMNILDLLTGYERTVLDVDKVFNNDTDPLIAMANIKDGDDVIDGLKDTLHDMGIINQGVNGSTAKSSTSVLSQVDPIIDDTEEFDLAKNNSLVFNNKIVNALIDLLKCK